MVLRCDDSRLVPSPGCLRSLCPHRCPRPVRSTHRSPEWSRRSPPRWRRSGTAGSIPPRCSARSVAAAPNRERSCTPRSPPTVRERSAFAGRALARTARDGKSTPTGAAASGSPVASRGCSAAMTPAWRASTPRVGRRRSPRPCRRRVTCRSAPARTSTTSCCRRSSSSGSRASRRIGSGDVCASSSVIRRLGPFPGLLLPPAPARLQGRPAWWFHPLGIERKRADGARRGRATSRPPLGVGRPGAARRGRQVAAPARRRRLDRGDGAGDGDGRPRRGRRRRLSPEERHRVRPRRRGPGHRRTHARTPLAVRRSARPRHPGPVAARAPGPEIRPASTNPADVALVNR